MGETHVHAVAGLAGFTGADAVRQDDVVAGGVQELSWAEQHAGELGLHELLAGSRRCRAGS